MAGNMKKNLGDVIDLWKRIPDGVFEGIHDTRLPEEREGLVEMFAVKDAAGDKDLRRLAGKRTKKKLP